MFAAVISQWRKDHMRNTLKGVKKSLDDSDRARKAAIVRMVGIEHNVAMFVNYGLV